MATSFFETGHVKNAANLLKYNQFLATLGTTYNPSNTAITTTAFATLHATAQAKINAIATALTNWKNDQNARETEFDNLNSFSTQLLGALKSTGAPQQTINDFSSLVGKMRGDIEGKLTKADAGKLNTSNDGNSNPEETTSKSTSQQSFDQKLEHFNKMILLLQSVTSYAPNEVQFQLTTLNAKQVTLNTVNDNANNSKSLLTSSRIDRNLFFYDPTTGVLELVKQSKEYIKSVFGAKSQQYKTAQTFRFTRVVPKKNAK